jgi:putative ABC transport system substrate-binding protein
LLKEVAPGVTRVAVIFNPETAVDSGWYFIRPIEIASRVLGVEVVAATVHDPSEVEAAVSAISRQPGGGLIVIPDLFNSIHRDLIVGLAIRERVPAVYGAAFNAADGGLVAYGIDPSDLWRRSASYVDRILKGEKAGDLPLQAPTKFQLIVNLKTAKAIGLTIPESFLLRADEVIE